MVLAHVSSSREGVHAALADFQLVSEPNTSEAIAKPFQYSQGIDVAHKEAAVAIVESVLLAIGQLNLVLGGPVSSHARRLRLARLVPVLLAAGCCLLSSWSKNDTWARQVAMRCVSAHGTFDSRAQARANAAAQANARR